MRHSSDEAHRHHSASQLLVLRLNSTIRVHVQHLCTNESTSAHRMRRKAVAASSRARQRALQHSIRCHDGIHTSSKPGGPKLGLPGHAPTSLGLWP